MNEFYQLNQKLQDFKAHVKKIGEQPCLKALNGVLFYNVFHAINDHEMLMQVIRTPDDILAAYDFSFEYAKQGHKTRKTLKAIIERKPEILDQTVLGVYAKDHSLHSVCQSLNVSPALLEEREVMLKRTYNQPNFQDKVRLYGWLTRSVKYLRGKTLVAVDHSDSARRNSSYHVGLIAGISFLQSSEGDILLFSESFDCYVVDPKINTKKEVATINKDIADQECSHEGGLVDGLFTLKNEGYDFDRIVLITDSPWNQLRDQTKRINLEKALKDFQRAYVVEQALYAPLEIKDKGNLHIITGFSSRLWHYLAHKEFWEKDKEQS